MKLRLMASAAANDKHTEMYRLCCLEDAGAPAQELSAVPANEHSKTGTPGPPAFQSHIPCFINMYAWWFLQH